jgi:hypothetical protein
MIRKHIHQFRRKVYKNGEAIFFCILDCDYKINVDLSVGKESICNRCNKQFTMIEPSVRLHKPHCFECTKHYVMDGGKRRTRKERDEIVFEIIDKLPIPIHRIVSKSKSAPIQKPTKSVYDKETEELRKLLDDSGIDTIDLDDAL